MIETIEKAKEHLRQVCGKIADNYNIDAQVDVLDTYVEAKIGLDDGVKVRAMSVPPARVKGDNGCVREFDYSEHVFIFASDAKTLTIDSPHELSPQDYVSVLNLFFSIGGYDEP